MNANTNTIIVRRTHVPTQGYSEPDEDYRDRIETKALERRVERADSQRVLAAISTLEVLGV